MALGQALLSHDPLVQCQTQDTRQPTADGHSRGTCSELVLAIGPLSASSMRRYNQSSLLISVLALVAVARCRGALAETAPAAPAAEQASRVIVGRHAQMGSRVSGCCGAAEVGAAFAAAAAATQDRCRRHMVRFCRPSQPARRRSRLLPLAVCLRGPTTAP